MSTTQAQSARESVDPTADRVDKLEALRKKLSVGTVSWSKEAERIFGLPRRPPPGPDALAALSFSMTEKLKREGGQQVLRPLQAWALYEGPLSRGLLGNMALGSGKTLTGLLMPMVWPNCKRAVLLIPAKLRVQLFEHDWEFYGRHWKLPNLAGKPSEVGTAGRYFVPGRPVLHIIAYSELSSPNSSMLLDQIQPDLILCDEVHNLRNYSAARVKRFFRYLASHETVSLAGWSGTITNDSIKDYAYLAAAMLGDKSPVPFMEPALSEWATVLDAGDSFADPGVLRNLCTKTESTRQGYHRRLIDTYGVISSAEDEVGSELTFLEWKVKGVPQNIVDHLRVCRRKEEPKRPDGEILVEPLDQVRCARQLACGFYSFWKFPKNEPLELRKDWFVKRQMFNAELRQRLKLSIPHCDSPKLCENAAQRFLDGGCKGCNRGPREYHAKDCKYAETHPLWDSFTWPYWRDIENQVVHETATKWESDFLLKEMMTWLDERKAAGETGIVWVEFVEVGHQLSKLAKIPYYGEGDKAKRGIQNEDGKRSVILSIQSNNEGLNLQDRFFNNFFATFPSSAKLAGQAIGRTHRPFQKRDEVFVWYCAHTSELRDGIEYARTKADYSTETWSEHKLSCGTWVTDDAARKVKVPKGAALRFVNPSENH